MSRRRSSSLPPTTLAFSDNLRDVSDMQSVAIARPPLLLNHVESNAELGPMRKRSVSDPTSGARVSTNPTVGDDRDLSCSPGEVASWSDESSAEDAWNKARTKDAVRRYHVLKELLATEYGYLEDLRFLVTVYFRNLSTLLVRSLGSTSTFASFTTGPSSSWMHPSSSHVSSALGQPTDSQIMSAAPGTSLQAKTSSSRFLFTDQEVELLTRNGEEILQFHERFYNELCMLLEPLGFSCQCDEPHIADQLRLADVDEVTRIVSTRFLTEAYRFNIYQTFCAGHPEAMDVLRKALRQFPVDLDVFERRSSSIVSEMLESKNKALVRESPSSTQIFSHMALKSDSRCLSVDSIIPPALEDRKRTLSLTTLDDRTVSKLKGSSSLKPLKLRASMTAITAISIVSRNKGMEDFDAVVRLSDDGTSPDSQRSTTTSSGMTASEPTKSSRKITMVDYLIKPVQRICKYPLLLDQLLPSKPLREVSRKDTAGAGLVDVVESAAQAMRCVAASVDAARERQSIATQSSLIFSRICLGLQVQGMLSSGYPYSPNPGTPPHANSSSRGSVTTQSQNSSQVRLLTPAFLSSLGLCLLSGSLDVIHYSHPVNARLTGAIKGKVKMKAKYLGAFLYDGGYLIFVKVGKGRRYEPKHWFALDGWDIVSIDDDEAMPYSFRLSKAGQHFEFAASCVREKDFWLASIAEAVKHAPAWTGEPLASFMSDGSKSVASTSPPISDGEPVELSELGLKASSGDAGTLPTICSIPVVCEIDGSMLACESRSPRPDPLFASLRDHVHGKSGRKKRWSTMSGGGVKRLPQSSKLDEDTSSRRSSSSASVMSVFYPIHLTSLDREKEREKEKEADTIYITRPSATVRQAVDFGLQDVISSTCLSARAEAAWREKMDVGPVVWSSTRQKTSSTTSTGNMTILSKHESVRAPTKRKSPTVETLNHSAPLSASTKTSGRKNVKKLSLTSFSFNNDYDKSTSSLPDVPTLTTTSDSSSLQSSVLPTAMEDPSAPPMTFISVQSENPSQTKPSRSFVQSVKDLFNFRHVVTSPVSVIVSHPTQGSLHSIAYVDVLPEEAKVATNPGYSSPAFLRRFRKHQSPHGECGTEGEELDFVTITSIHEAEEDVAREKFSIALPLIASPMRVV